MIVIVVYTLAKILWIFWLIGVLAGFYPMSEDSTDTSALKLGIIDVLVCFGMLLVF